MDLMDFCGFTFNGVHSSTLGFVRVSNGSRYSDSLVPDFQDQTVDVPGGNGTYFFNSFYKNKPFSIDIAFDSITEVQYRMIRQTFAADVIGELIFDEAPYKAYTAKVQSPPSLNYICFDEGGQRIYKGEGTIQFICYYPFAKSVHKFLNQYADSSYLNKAEWQSASGMSTIQGSYDNPGSSINLYNPGDLETDFYAYFPFNGSQCELAGIYLSVNSSENFISFNPIQNARTGSSGDTYVRVSSKTNLVEGCNASYEPTGSLYNLYVTSGDFFKIPKGESQLIVQGTTCSKIDYDYLYY